MGHQIIKVIHQYSYEGVVVKQFYLVFMVLAAATSALNLVAWILVPNHWVFGVAFIGFSFMAVVCYMSASKPHGVKVQVYGCARCTQDHQIYFKPFIYQPVIDKDEVEYTHWAMCPVLNEPILMRIIDEDTKHAENH